LSIDPVLLGVAGLFGLTLGSFLNVCITRLPEDQSVVRPRSRCPKCEHAIAWYDNVPVVSWLVLGGRCRHCRAAISPLYPLVELAVAGIWVGVVWHYGPNLRGVVAGLFGTILLGIAVTDARTYLIPNEYTLGGLGLGLFVSGAGGVPGVLHALIGAATGFGILYLVAWGGGKVFGQDAMGGGDIKMMAMVGAFLGWQGVLLTLFGGAFLGTLVFLPFLFRKERPLVPFGVFLAAAAAVTFVFGDAILSWYVGYLQGG
jgi:leader peptidase (prepilin peptidase) / N-methyltransferase